MGEKSPGACVRVHTCKRDDDDEEYSGGGHFLLNTFAVEPASAVAGAPNK